MRLAERDKLQSHYREQLRKQFEFFEKIFDGVGFCLSQEGDLLSQWRGYAQDARGVSIGFSREYLLALSDVPRSKEKSGFRLSKVRYSPSDHEAKLEPTYQELRRLIDEGALHTPTALSILHSEAEASAKAEQTKKLSHSLALRLLSLSLGQFELKSSAFSEEQEWRLISPVAKQLADDCLYRSAQNRVIPYRVVNLIDLGIPSITDVVLGPKHQTPKNIVEAMMKTAGFDDVRVHMSQASYR